MRFALLCLFPLLPVALDSSKISKIHKWQSRHNNYKYSAKARTEVQREGLYEAVTHVYQNRNIFFSSEIIRSSLAFIYIGAEDTSADEMERAFMYLGLVFNDFHLDTEKLLDIRFNGAPFTQSLTRFFVKKEFKLSVNYTEHMRHVEGEAYNIDFSSENLKETNDLFTSQLSPLLGEVIPSATWQDNQMAYLVNAMYFNMSWKRTFNTDATYMRAFHVSQQRIVRVEMMHEDSKFQWGVLSTLNATALALPFAEAELHMLLIKPDRAEDLETLQVELAHLDIAALIMNLTECEVFVALPKLRMHSDLDLRSVMERLEVRSIFQMSNDFSTLLESNAPFRVTGLHHVVSFEFNEQGVGQAPTPAGFGSLTTTFTGVKYFIADHPFTFFIIDKESVFFAGHITTF